MKCFHRVISDFIFRIEQQINNLAIFLAYSLIHTNEIVKEIWLSSKKLFIISLRNFNCNFPVLLYCIPGGPYLKYIFVAYNCILLQVVCQLTNCLTKASQVKKCRDLPFYVFLVRTSTASPSILCIILTMCTKNEVTQVQFRKKNCHQFFFKLLSSPLLNRRSKRKIPWLVI